MNGAALRSRATAGTAAAIDTAVARLAELDRRLLAVVLAAGVAFSAFECWVLLLRGPLAEYRTLQVAQPGTLRPAPAVPLDGEIARLAARHAAQSRELAAAAAAPRSDDDAVLDLIEALGGLAVRHGIALGRVAAAPHATVGGFEETGFTVEARGPYRALHLWLAEVRRERPALVVAEIGLRSVEGGAQRAATLRLVGYRPVAAAAAPAVAAAAAAQGRP